MSTTLSIPPATRERLANPAAPGQRHAEIVRVVSSLIANGQDGEVVFCQLRPNYAADVPDAEIRDVIRWAKNRFPPGSRNTAGAFRKPVVVLPCNPHPGKHADNRPPLTPETAVCRFLNGFTCDEVDLWEASPVRLTARFETDAETLLSAHYLPGESVNIVSRYTVTGEKARPNGCGETATREQWLSAFRENGPPVSDSGVWIRPNPTDGTGISDANVACFRFALVEFDSIPISLQVPFLAKLPLAIAAVITSGGKSLHAWILISARNAVEYHTAVAELFQILAPFGIDKANRNPSRLSRLPGTTRKIGAASDNRQRLLYLNPFPVTAKIIR